LAVPDVGSRIADSIHAYLNDLNHWHEIERLKAAGLQLQTIEQEIIRGSDQLEGKTFLISGVFENYSREELSELIEHHGGKIQSSISGKLQYLVAGDKMGPSKLAKAEKLQIPIISDQDL